METIDRTLTLRGLREYFELTQEEMAKKLGVEQPQVTRAEHRPNFKIDTLRKYIAALGGDIEIYAVIDDLRVKLVL